MEATQQTARTSIPYSGLLCQHCIDNEVPQLLDDIRDYKFRAEDGSVHVWTASNNTGDDHDDIGDTENSETNPGISLSVGCDAERRIELGTAASILRRKGCPVCDIVIHVLPSEFHSNLSDVNVRLHRPKPDNPGRPSFAVVTKAGQKRSRPPVDRDNQKLYITTISTGDVLTWGCIHASPSRPTNTMLSSSDDGQQEIVQHLTHLQPELLLSVLVGQEYMQDITFKAWEYAFNSTPEQHKVIGNHLKPLFEFLDDGPGLMAMELNEQKLEVRRVTSAVEGALQYIASTQPAPHESQFRILLIDVEENRLVEASTSEKYLALSYVWGTGQVFKTMSTDRERLAKKDSLNCAKLPRIVLDAMSFTKRMEQRYLWVDALCIEQDDVSTQKAAQIANMDAIYRDAYLTLIAWTAKSSDSELPGVSEHLRPQIIRREVGGLLLENHLSEDLALLSDYGKISHYETRAWTFQERLLSKRCLFFHEREALFVSKSDGSTGSVGVSCLELAPGPKGKATGRVLMEVTDKRNNIWTSMFKLMGDGVQSAAPQLEQYGQFVDAFVELNLTKSSDRLNAFQGLLQHMRPDIGDTVSGLPISSSPYCLLWNQDDSDQQATRNHHFPTWSWAGWEGKSSYAWFADNRYEFCIEKIHGSETAYSHPRLLWAAGRDLQPDEADHSISLGSIRFLRFHAETASRASGLGSLPEIPEHHMYVLMAMGKRFDAKKHVKVMEVKPIGNCFERVKLCHLEMNAWQSATRYEQSICLQ
ncbi:hypothetical protein CGMCC3_g13769 [Colletotrichum fructicola]|uniref:Heterokaryon incompatibility domain-containing protein n=1 Tax=Colletotrichum fructicola (strain Nara gc5) TaxID=1213859 RepID=L2FQS7_COLFN|nr:uncharacterized protein CGMCC3_g13769 [Colletotrichum fructicola]KAE9570135.1 hypothetical protein CGMCC3_g13769 [Colletotrichum fructicola]KAF4421675.1 hypothetical protein CFRS1_v013973 [Colletotrichum fructicola]KAF4478074.1 hypothetical protein CGGC5_v014225 [Colletotrichum fructicola Nara gc5]KAF4888995.1 hypothetical protein CGCFRS4_v009595 [Colletotrichum fructicola]